MVSPPPIKLTRKSSTDKITQMTRGTSGEPGRNGAYNNAAIHYYGNLIAKEHFHLPPEQVRVLPAIHPLNASEMHHNFELFSCVS